MILLTATLARVLLTATLARIRLTATLARIRLTDLLPSIRPGGANPGSSRGRLRSLKAVAGDRHSRDASHRCCRSSDDENGDEKG